jgi:hypothetical protein
VKRGTLRSGGEQVQSGSAFAAQSNARSAPSLAIVATATVTPGAITQRVAHVGEPKPVRVRSSRTRPDGRGGVVPLKTGQRRIFAGRSATKVICISLGVEDLAQLDADAIEAGLSRSTYITECWRKARREP